MSFFDFVGDFFTGGAVTANKNASANLKAQQQNLAYQKQLQQIMFNRADTAVQRRVNDLVAAGLNPNLAANQGAEVGSPVATTAPQSNFVGYGNGFSNFLSNAMGIAQTGVDMARSFQDYSNTKYNTGLYKKWNLPIGYSGLGADAVMLANAGSSVAQALLGTEGAAALASSLQNLASLGSKGAQAFEDITKGIDALVQRNVTLFNDYATGKISFPTLISRGFGLDLGFANNAGLTNTPFSYTSNGNILIDPSALNLGTRQSERLNSAVNAMKGGKIVTNRSGETYRLVRMPSGSMARIKL